MGGCRHSATVASSRAVLLVLVPVKRAEANWTGTIEDLGALTRATGSNRRNGRFGSKTRRSQHPRGNRRTYSGCPVAGVWGRSRNKTLAHGAIQLSPKTKAQTGDSLGACVPWSGEGPGCCPDGEVQPIWMEATISSSAARSCCDVSGKDPATIMCRSPSMSRIQIFSS